MRKIFRIYNQNRTKFWAIILVIVLIIVLIQFFNSNAKDKLESNLEKTNINQNNITNNKNTGSPIISGTKLNQNQIDTNANIIEKFLDYCISNDFEEAYNMLSINCKEVNYNTLEDFENVYCKDKFSSEKKYEYELWSSKDNFVYRIKIFDDLLATGGNTLKSKFIEDYYTIIYEEDGEKLNINSYINRKNINKSIEKNDVKVSVNYLDMFKEHYVYSFTVKNDTNNTILLDTRSKTNSVYLTNSFNTKFIGLLYENLERDLIIDAGEEKTINIKFNIQHRDNMDIKKITFSDIVTDYDKYINEMNYAERLQIDIDL